MWNHLSPEALISLLPAYGLAPKQWEAQLKKIRALPETQER